MGLLDGFLVSFDEDEDLSPFARLHKTKPHPTMPPWGLLDGHHPGYPQGPDDIFSRGLPARSPDLRAGETMELPSDIPEHFMPPGWQLDVGKGYRPLQADQPEDLETVVVTPGLGSVRAEAERLGYDPEKRAAFFGRMKELIDDMAKDRASAPGIASPDFFPGGRQINSDILAQIYEQMLSGRKG